MGSNLYTLSLTHQWHIQDEMFNLWTLPSNLGQRHRFGSQYNKDEAIAGGQKTTQEKSGK